MLHVQKVIDTEDEDSEFLGIPSSDFKEGIGMIPHEKKKRLYAAPDYAMVVTDTSLPILLRDLESFFANGGAYYEFFRMELETDKLVVVIFLDDSLLDALAEIQRMKARMDELNCRTEF